MTENTMSRVLWEVGGERRRQDAKWGGPEHDDTHDRIGWEDLLNFRVLLAHQAQADEPRWRRRMLQVAALAVAAVEWHDRQDAQPPSTAFRRTEDT